MGEHRAPEEEIGMGGVRAAFGIPLGNSVIKKKNRKIICIRRRGS